MRPILILISVLALTLAWQATALASTAGGQEHAKSSPAKHAATKQAATDDDEEPDCD